MYPSDFPAEAAPPLLDPTLLLVLVLIVAALVAVAFWLGQLHNARALAGQQARACAEIHDFVSRRCQAAMRAGRHEVTGQAAKLNEAIRQALGPLLDLGGPTATLAASLEAACHGRPVEAHADGHEPAEGHGSEGETAGEASTRVRIDRAENVIIQGGAHDHGGDSGHGPKGPAGVDPAAVRAAVAAFSDHWSQPRIVEELKALQHRLNAPNLPKERPGR